MNKLHVKDMMHKAHIPTAHQMVLKTEHLLKDPRFWAVLAMAAVTALVITMAILTRPTGDPTPMPTTPIIPAPYIY